MAWGKAGAASSGRDLPAVDEMLRSHGVPIERLRTLACIEALRKEYLLGSRPAQDIDPAPFGDIGRHIDLRGRFLDPQRPWSPTMLEDAAACPFAFFGKHVLRLQSRPEPDYDVSPAALGELAHNILSEFLHAAPPRQAAAAVQRMRAIANRILARRHGDPGLGHPGFWHIRKAELLAVLDDLAVYLATRQSDVYRTHYQAHDLAAAVTCGPWSVALQGHVDRVAFREGASGIDAVLVQDFRYSGSVGRYRARLAPGALGQSSFQLPISLYLTLQQLAQDGYRLAPDAELHVQYVLLKDPKRKVWDTEVSHSFFEPDQVGGLLHSLQPIAELALAGRFVPRPLESKHTCTACRYAALCRYWTSGAGAESWRDEGSADEGT
jgi:hypothetical protein